MFNHGWLRKEAPDSARLLQVKEEFLQTKVSLDTLRAVLRPSVYGSQKGTILFVLSFLTLEREISNKHKTPCLGDISSLTVS